MRRPCFDHAGTSAVGTHCVADAMAATRGILRIDWTVSGVSCVAQVMTVPPNTHDILGTSERGALRVSVGCSTTEEEVPVVAIAAVTAARVLAQ